MIEECQRDKCGFFWQTIVGELIMGTGPRGFPRKCFVMRTPLIYQGIECKRFYVRLIKIPTQSSFHVSFAHLLSLCVSPPVYLCYLPLTEVAAWFIFLFISKFTFSLHAQFWNRCFRSTMSVRHTRNLSVLQFPQDSHADGIYSPVLTIAISRALLFTLDPAPYAVIIPLCLPERLRYHFN